MKLGAIRPLGKSDKKAFHSTTKVFAEELHSESKISTKRYSITNSTPKSTKLGLLVIQNEDGSCFFVL